MMKYLLMLLTLLILPTTVLATPRLQAETALFNFGRVAEGSKTEHTFRFQNTGDTPLIISKVRSSCGCTAALLSAKELAPGEWGELKTTFNSKGFQGAVTKKVYVYSNDPDQQKATFRLQGEVQKELLVSPRRLQFSAGKGKAPFTGTINLRNDGTTKLFLSNLKTTSEELQAELSSSQLEPGKNVQISIRLVPNTNKSRYAGYVTLHTSSPRTPTLRIPVTAVLSNSN
ncbi:MAG: hypothetical protein BA870_11640 [Desulfuromonadales bacterium C00003094]|jgi:hypothetical protein|nr:MAG: hypothetical protein BA870_11640 [Desulfuromonadales bacterium C00003094]OEU74703.1 MAG: hypothetical protein BA869_06410 [Desulfuromonadales bacterium C00003107]